MPDACFGHSKEPVGAVHRRFSIPYLAVSRTSIELWYYLFVMWRDATLERCPDSPKANEFLSPWQSWHEGRASGAAAMEAAYGPAFFHASVKLVPSADNGDG